MKILIRDIKNCTICAEYLPHGINPVFQIHPESKVVIIGQAPGRKVHLSGVPWDDKSGERLRDWLSVDRETFYDPARIALVPMGFCFPGKGKSGDLPPRPECAPQWHPRILSAFEDEILTILIGQYAQKKYLENPKHNLTETVRNFEEYLPGKLVLPHPSPRNNIWLRKNPWFEKELLPVLRKSVRLSLEGS